jgi:AraC family transcriptional regulator
MDGVASNSPQNLPDAWARLFAGGQVRSSAAAALAWPDARVDVVKSAPAQPEYVRSEQGSYHGIVLFTDGVDEAEDRLEHGPVHYSGVAPGDLHVYSRSRNEEPHLSRWRGPLSFVSVRLTPLVVAKACRAAGLPYDGVTFASRFSVDDPFLEQLVRQFAQTLGRAGDSAPALQIMYVEKLAQAAAAHLVRQYTSQEPVLEDEEGTTLPTARVQRVEAYVEAHLDEDLTLEDLAAVACYSEYHFCRAFKRTTGYSPYQFVIRKRLHEAARLLRRHRHRTVASIARAVGYDSSSHFSRQFKKHYGTPPSTWRRESKR